MGKKRNLGKPLAESEHTGFDYSQSQRQFNKGQKEKFGNLKKGIKERKTTEEKIDSFNRGMIKGNAVGVGGGLLYAAIKKING